MTSNLYWEPIKPTPSSRCLSTELKFALRKSFDNPIRTELDEESLGYLAGLRDGGIEDAQKLIDAIKKYGSIQLWEDYG